MLKCQLIGLTTIFIFVASSCTRMQKEDGGHVEELIESRIRKEVYWNKNCYEDPQIQVYLQDLTSRPQTIEIAVQIALLNNPHIQAMFEELGIAQADFVEAGLLSNPAFQIETRYPHEKKLRTNIEYLITTAFLDIFLIPLRLKLASAELEQAQYRVSNEILNLTFEVRQTYYELIAEKQKLQYTKAIVELINIHNEIVSRQILVGNVNLLGFQQIRARFLEAKLEIAKSESEIIRMEEKFYRLLGFSSEVCLALSEELPKQEDYQGFELCSLEKLALERRLDIQMAHFEIIRISRMLGLKDGWTYTNLQIGLAGERDPDGTNLLGYGVGGEIPLFNYGQAARMRLFAQLRQAYDRLAALKIRALSEVREAHKLLMNNLMIINEYRNEILPLQNKILNSSQELYNVMGMGIDNLLENKRQEIEAHRNYLESLKDYWTARVQLDKALGGYLFLLIMTDNPPERGVE